MSSPPKNGSRVALSALAFTLLLAIIGGAVAWGDSRSRVQENTRRLIVNEGVIKKLLEGQARIDERTRSIERNQTETKGDVKEILRELRRPRRTIR